MAEFRPIKKGTSTQFAEMGGTDTIPASLIGIVPKFEVPSGLVNGSNTAYTLSATPVANASVIMVLDGVTQTNGTDYTVSGTTVTFTTAPASGTEIVAIYNSAASAGGGDFSSNTSSSVDGEVVLFSGTGGKTGKRATGTGFAKLASGVLSASTITIGITFIIDGGGSAITTGSKGFIVFPVAATIDQWTVIADQGGSIVVDVKRSTYSGFPTTTSIVGAGNKPTLSSAQKNQAAPASWTSTAIVAGDVLEFNVDSITTVRRVTLMLRATIS